MTHFGKKTSALYITSLSRKAGFPRGHPLSPCGQMPPPIGQRNPAIIAPRELGNTRNAEGGSGSSGHKDPAASKAAHRLVFDVFCRLDGAGSQRNRNEGAHKNNNNSTGSAVQRSGADAMVTGKAVKGGRKLPKRLRRVVPLMEQLLERAHGCNFGRLLEAHCPLPQSALKKKAPGQTARGLCTGAADAEQLPPKSPDGSLSDASTLRDPETEGAKAASAWPQAGGVNGKSGEEDVGSSGDEEGSINSFSTLRDPCSEPQSQSQPQSQSPTAGGVPGHRACWGVGRGNGAGAGAPSHNNAQHWRPVRDDWPTDAPGELRTVSYYTLLGPHELDRNNRHARSYQRFSCERVVRMSGIMYRKTFAWNDCAADRNVIEPPPGVAARFASWGRCCNRQHLSSFFSPLKVQKNGLHPRLLGLCTSCIT